MEILNMPCLSTFILLLCLEYNIVTCKNDDPSVVHTISGENNGLEWSETCYSADCPTTQTTVATTQSKTDGLAVNHGYPNLFNLIYGSVSNAVKAVYVTATNAGEEMYSTILNTTAEFAEKVRKVLREEFNHLILNGFTNIIGEATAPGTALYSLGITALSFTLFLLCLILNYIFLFFLSFISIITFDCIVVALHYVFGPKLIFDCIFIFSNYFGRILFFVWGYPYFFALLVTSLLCISCLMPIIRLVTRRNHRKQIRALADNMVHLNMTIEDIRTQLNEIESKIDTILRTIEETS